MGQTRLSVTDVQNESLAAQAATAYRTRGVPADWYVDPADPGAAAFHERENHQNVSDAATAFLELHEADKTATGNPATAEPTLSPADDSPFDSSPVDLIGAAQDAIWIGLRPDAADIGDEGELGWQTDALCAQTDPEAFFPEKGGSTRDAKKVCGACNVKAQCLEYALANDERFGIWGGLSERERRRLRKRAV